MKDLHNEIPLLEDVFHERSHAELAEDHVLDPDLVAEYLRQHPDFFIEYESLLSELALPHHTGEHAISLVERQVSVLRARNRDVRQRLNRLLDIARDNDRLFQKTQRLVLSLLEQRDEQGVVDAVETSLRDDYQVDVCRLLLLQGEVLQAAQQQIGALLTVRQPICGHLRPEEMTFLFEHATQPVQSAAVVAIARSDAAVGEGLLAVLAIGSFDPEHYRSGMGTMFLSYIADVVSRTLLRCETAA